MLGPFLTEFLTSSLQWQMRDKKGKEKKGKHAFQLGAVILKYSGSFILFVTCKVSVYLEYSNCECEPIHLKTKRGWGCSSDSDFYILLKIEAVWCSVSHNNCWSFDYLFLYLFHKDSGHCWIFTGGNMEKKRRHEERCPAQQVSARKTCHNTLSSFVWRSV